jgi:hypothetical protein
MSIQASKISEEAYDFISQNGGSGFYSQELASWQMSIPANWQSESEKVEAWSKYGSKTYYWPEGSSIQIVKYPPMDGDPSEISLYRA